ncbi:MAG: O-antigen ligase family protein [Clostridia bacterium]|nr:O-antigen ligase family protein [Clostridia bacterium]
MNGLLKGKSLCFSQIVLYAALLVAGVFHEFVSCLLAVVLLVWLGVQWGKKKTLSLCLTPAFGAMVALVLAYGATVLWAVDSGMAVFGFFKFLPLPLYMLVLMQQPDGRQRAIDGLPYAVTLMTVFSVVGMYLPVVSVYFTVSGRLSGFLQYPNTFAVLLLIAELLLLTGDRPRWWDYGCISILLFGILSTGSRTVFLLTVAANGLALLLHRNKKVRWVMLACIVAGVALVLVYCAVTDRFGVLGRYLNINLKESTFAGRILYMLDALPLVARHPFGLGYMGYYYMEQSIQTGLYAITYVHNDLLQILLDVGWVPFAAFMTAVGMSFFSRAVPMRHKLVMAVMLVHALFDFDLQYIAVFMVLLLLMAPTPCKNLLLSRGRGLWYALTGLLAVACLYVGTVQGLTYFKCYDEARDLYPWHTANEIRLLQELEDPAEAAVVADRILDRNPHVSVAYSVKSRYAYSIGDFASVITYKEKTIETAPFFHSEYWEYGDMLISGIRLYTKAGDIASAKVCERALLALSDKLAVQEERLSEYGAAIDTQPIFYLRKDQREYIAALKGEE